MTRIIGIMGAMPEEVDGIIQLMEDRQEIVLGKRIYHSGTINNVKTVVTFSRWGKVAAAATVSTLILKFGISELIFTGVAGAIHHELKIGDIVIGSSLIQHDMDARPLYSRYEIPLLNISHFACAERNADDVAKAIKKAIAESDFRIVFKQGELDKFGITRPSIYTGLIASGDKFFASKYDKEQLLTAQPDVLCVEMEGAAVAQVCYEYDIPFTVVRVISDDSDETAEINFPEFIREISSKYSVLIVQSMFGML
jgi:adenosylhomocysteine nucleosidase